LIKNYLTVLVLLFLFATQNIFAQSWQLGVKGGLSLPNLTSSGGSEVSMGYKTISGPDFALTSEYKLSKKFSLEADIEWSTQGGQKTGLQAIPASPDLASYFPPGLDPSYLYANFNTGVKLQYLMLPVLFKYYFDLGRSKKWKLYADCGIFGALLMNANAYASGTSKVYFDKQETFPATTLPVKFDSTGNIKDQIHQGNFGVEANLGILYQITSFSIFAEGGGNYGFIDLQKDSQNGVNHTGALIFRIGIMLFLKSGDQLTKP
jgi:hypothetical protein